jgi:hypothetical protein
MQSQFFGVVYGGQWAPPILVQLQGNMRYQILVEPMENILSDLDLFVHDPRNGALLAWDKTFNSSGYIMFVAPYSGPYHLNVASKSGTTSFRLTVSNS